MMITRRLPLPFFSSDPGVTRHRNLTGGPCGEVGPPSQDTLLGIELLSAGMHRHITHTGHRVLQGQELELGLSSGHALLILEHLGQQFIDESPRTGPQRPPELPSRPRRSHHSRCCWGRSGGQVLLDQEGVVGGQILHGLGSQADHIEFSGGIQLSDRMVVGAPATVKAASILPSFRSLGGVAEGTVGGGDVSGSHA